MTDVPTRVGAEVVAYIGLGANLCEPEAQVRDAMRELGELEHCRMVACSSLYANPPMGPADQPDYVNAVVALCTSLEPESLLDSMQGIERAHGRVRDKQSRWGPRTLDLDLLLYGNQSIDSERLSVPHPGMHERVFVLVPLHEIAPDLFVPGRGALKTLAAGIDRTALKRLD